MQNSEFIITQLLNAKAQLEVQLYSAQAELEQTKKQLETKEEGEK